MRTLALARSILKYVEVYAGAHVGLHRDGGTMRTTHRCTTCMFSSSRHGRAPYSLSKGILAVANVSDNPAYGYFYSSKLCTHAVHALSRDQQPLTKPEKMVRIFWDADNVRITDQRVDTITTQLAACLNTSVRVQSIDAFSQPMHVGKALQSPQLGGMTHVDLRAPKPSTDMSLALAAMNAANEQPRATYVIVSNDRDFMPLVTALKRHVEHVFMACFPQSSSKHVFKEICGYISLSGTLTDSAPKPQTSQSSNNGSVPFETPEESSDSEADEADEDPDITPKDSPEAKLETRLNILLKKGSSAAPSTFDERCQVLSMLIGMVSVSTLETVRGKLRNMEGGCTLLPLSFDFSSNLTMEASIHKNMCGGGDTMWTVQERVDIIKRLRESADIFACELGHLLLTVELRKSGPLTRDSAGQTYTRIPRTKSKRKLLRANKSGKILLGNVFLDSLANFEAPSDSSTSPCDSKRAKTEVQVKGGLLEVTNLHPEPLTTETTNGTNGQEKAVPEKSVRVFWDASSVPFNKPTYDYVLKTIEPYNEVTGVDVFATRDSAAWNLQNCPVPHGAVMHVPLGLNHSEATTAALSILWLLKAAQEDTTSTLLLVSNDTAPLRNMLHLPCLQHSAHIVVVAPSEDPVHAALRKQCVELANCIREAQLLDAHVPFVAMYLRLQRSREIFQEDGIPENVLEARSHEMMVTEIVSGLRGSSGWSVLETSNVVNMLLAHSTTEDLEAVGELLQKDLQDSKSRAESEDHGAQKGTNMYKMVCVELMQEVAACAKTNWTQIQQQNGSNGVKDDLEPQQNNCIDRLCVRLSQCLQRCSMGLFSSLQIHIRQRPDADCVQGCPTSLATCDNMRRELVLGFRGESGWSVAEKVAVATLLTNGRHSFSCEQLGFLLSVENPEEWPAFEVNESMVSVPGLQDPAVEAKALKFLRLITSYLPDAQSLNSNACTGALSA